MLFFKEQPGLPPWEQKRVRLGAEFQTRPSIRDFLNKKFLMGEDVDSVCAGAMRRQVAGFIRVSPGSSFFNHQLFSGGSDERNRTGEGQG